MDERSVGFVGGGNIVAAGTVADMQLFFDCIGFFAVPRHAGEDWSLVTDRLYRRYVRQADVEATRRLMDLALAEMARTPVDAVDLRQMRQPGARTNLDPRGPFLDKVFARHFQAFGRAAEGAIARWEDGGKDDPTYAFEPPHASVTDLGWLLTNRISLSHYDELEGLPLWRR